MREHLKLLVAICMTSFLSSFMGASLSVAMPYVANDYHVSPENITWMINAFTASTAAFLLTASALADRFGYLKIFLVGSVIGALLSAGVALAPDLTTSSIIRGLQGVSFSLIFCTTMALISQRIPAEKRAFAIAYTVASVYAGLTFSPIISGILVETLGWQMMFYITAVGMLVSFSLACTAPKDKPLTNTLPYGRMFASFVIGLAILFGLSYYTSDTRVLYILIAAVVALIVYLVIEYKSEHPLLPAKFIYSNKVMRYALLAAAFHYFASFGFILLLAMHLQIILGYSATTVGMMLLLQPVLMVICSSCSGKLSHLVGPQYLTITGMSLCLIAILVLFTLEPNSPLYLIFIAQGILGVGFGIFSAPNTVIVMSSVDKRQYALASAVISIARTIGQAVSMAVITAIMHYLINAEPHTTLYVRELSYSIHFSFNVSAGAYCCGLIFCLLCLRSRVAFLKQRKLQEEQSAQQNENATTAATANATEATSASESANQPHVDALNRDAGENVADVLNSSEMKQKQEV